jgi:hypothetical protein
MKKLTRFLVLSAVAAFVAIPAYSQATPQGGDTAQAAQADEKTKLSDDFRAAYDKWKKSSAAKSPTADEDYKAAYELAKQYVDKFGSTDEFGTYAKGFVTKYETYQKGARSAKVDQLLKDKKYTEAFALGKQILADNPDDLPTLFVLARGALIAGDQEALFPDATNYAKHALELIGQGKTFQEGQPIKDKEQVQAVLNYALGWFTRKASPSESAGYFFKAAQYNSDIKTDAQTYALLAADYEQDYNTVAKDYAAKFPDKTAQDTPEGKAATEKLNGVTDRLIDAYARAVAYAGSDAKYATPKAKWMERLTELYKFRHDGSDAGLNDLIASIKSKPLPSVSTAQPTGTASSTSPSGATN